jgi:hypothetical protein
MHRFRIVLLLVLLLTACSPQQPEAPFDVITHPDGPLYVGDQVSFEILSSDETITDGNIEVSYGGQVLGSALFSSFGIGKRSQATLWWTWDTRGLEAGRHTLTFTSLPDGPTWSESIRLRPADEVPPPEPEAHWASTTTDCCTLYYITGTDAERDLSSLSTLADSESLAVASELGTSAQQGMTLVFMPRLIGHGGFASSAVYVTYYDDNVIGNDMDILFHHEFVHFYDGKIGADYFPSIFQEGLAVYLSGGHFKPEPVGPRAAALLDLGWYIPLESLTNDFYNQQHDIGYLEAGALVQYLVETYGMGAFSEFYRTIPPPNGTTDAAVINDSLQESFGISLADLETAYLSSLRSQTVTDNERDDLRQTVQFFDSLRRYQEELDPSAYFLTAWLPDGEAMRQRGIVADFTRSPAGWDNRLMEALLRKARLDLFSGNYEGAERTLKWTNLALDILAP